MGYPRGYFVKPGFKPWLEIKYNPYSKRYMMHVSSFHYTDWKYFKIFCIFLFKRIANPFFIPKDTASPEDRKKLNAREKQFKKYWEKKNGA